MVKLYPITMQNFFKYRNFPYFIIIISFFAYTIITSLIRPQQWQFVLWQVAVLQRPKAWITEPPLTPRGTKDNFPTQSILVSNS